MTISPCEHSVAVPLGDRSYKILIQPGLLGQLGQILNGMGLTGRVAVVTNPVVNSLYGPAFKRACKRVGLSCMTIVIPDGERAKTMKWLEAILNELVSRRFERQDALVALGGGVVGDVTGFAAAIYLRGVPFIQVPTTLVAQVDSSVGGKTAVNHPLGKNLIGAFYQPKAVVIDPEVLLTLPEREWVAGLAEVIKYGVIADENFFEYLEGRVEALRERDEQIIPPIIRRCCEIKAEVVSGDERESGRRRILNYGHTVGHALETWGKYAKWIHGEAVGIGMVQEASIGHFLGSCKKEVVDRQTQLIRDVGLPVAMPQWSFSELWEAMQHDKKVTRGKINCVIPRRIGQVHVVPLFRPEIRKWFSKAFQGHQYAVGTRRSRKLGSQASRKK